jgi:hypothetical protein
MSGDFNVNPLHETKEFKEHVMSFNEQNYKFIEYSEKEYDLMMKALNEGEKETFIDIVLEDLGVHE